jgi:hypothetical protein
MKSDRCAGDNTCDHICEERGQGQFISCYPGGDPGTLTTRSRWRHGATALHSHVAASFGHISSAHCGCDSTLLCVGIRVCGLPGASGGHGA